MRSGSVERVTGARLELDDLDRRIVERLRVDGRATNRSLAGALGVSEATVATRLRGLESAQAVHVVALTDMQGLGMAWFAFLFVRVGGRPALEVATEIAAVESTIFVNLHTGRFDIICGALVRTREELAEVVGQVVPRIRGVRSVRCELAADVVRFDSSWAALGRIGAPAPPGPELPGGVLDDLDRAIITCLQRDARSSNRQIATGVAVSEGTVRARLRRLEGEGLLRIRAVSDILAFGLESAALIGLHVADGETAAVETILKTVPGVAAIIRCLGEFDYVVILLATSRTALAEVVLGRLQTIEHLRGVETFETIATVKHIYTWVRLLDGVDGLPVLPAEATESAPLA